MKRSLQAFLIVFGVVVIAISLAHFAIGHDAVMGGSQLNATSDGEDRFYAGIFGAFGAALIWCARDVEHRYFFISALAAAFFVGGIGRLLSLILVGPPHPFFVAMLILELVLPPILVLWARRVAVPSSQVGNRVA